MCRLLFDNAVSVIQCEKKIKYGYRDALRNMQGNRLGTLERSGLSEFYRTAEQNSVTLIVGDAALPIGYDSHFDSSYCPRQRSLKLQHAQR